MKTMDDLPELPFKRILNYLSLEDRLKLNAIRQTSESLTWSHCETTMNRTEATIDDLPELPFEKVLSYLSLRDRLKSRAVSRRWYHRINSFKVKSLCYSDRPSGFIMGKSRLVNGAFARNFISSTRFASFFDTFGQTILSSLKHLRLCDLRLDVKSSPALTRTINSFGKLEQLDIIRFNFGADLYPKPEFNLNLPMLNRIRLENVQGIEQLTLDATRLREVKIQDCSFGLRVKIVHGESVERLLVDRWVYTEVKNLKKVQILYLNAYQFDVKDLSGLERLKEIHLNHLNRQKVMSLFEQKQLYGRVYLKIYLGGFLLNGPHDPDHDQMISSNFGNLAENLWRLADETPFLRFLRYSAIERVAQGLDVKILKRFTDLQAVRVDLQVQDTQRFLNLLKNCENIISNIFIFDTQHQRLFDQLPEYSARIQELFIDREPSDLGFLFQLSHLTFVELRFPIDTETVRQLFEKLPFLSWISFMHLEREVQISVDQEGQFSVLLAGGTETPFSDLNAVIQFISEEADPECWID